MSGFRISNKTDYDVRFMSEDNKELLKLTPDGECYWNGRLVESDEDFKTAIISVSKYFIGASQPYHATIDRLKTELARYKQGVEVTGDYIDDPDNGHMWWLDLDDKLPFDNGQHVRVLVMKVEK